MRMDGVAEAAELSKGTLYLYFENKDALCAAVATRLLDTLLPFIESALEEASTGLDAVRRSAAEVLRLHPRQPSPLSVRDGVVERGRAHG